MNYKKKTVEENRKLGKNMYWSYDSESQWD